MSTAGWRQLTDIEDVEGGLGGSTPTVLGVDLANAALKMKTKGERLVFCTRGQAS